MENDTVVCLIRFDKCRISEQHLIKKLIRGTGGAMYQKRGEEVPHLLLLRGGCKSSDFIIRFARTISLGFLEKNEI
ncbi:hypothetical protein CEXT_424671 [Caerostris extrusa]|uniref:BRCT domain-containing protein n=1 Tax=Caerostris extrusa TaxID=172846 RepID=A0AAV4V4B8_CAEEX|nr:hypothetical protein CEXT_424671 [Caerostris extrusa]